MMHVAYIAAGSNLGDRAATIRAAFDRLSATPGVQALTASSLHETEPVGGPAGQGRYLNAAARVETSLPPHDLLAVLLRIEQELGRERRERWGPRTIDLDLLLYEDRVMDSAALTVPHPRLHELRFVLAPLAEVGAEARHPTLGATVAELLDRL